MLAGFEACYSGVVKYSQFWREPTGLSLPMKDQGARHDHQRRAAQFFRVVATRPAPRFQQREYLNGFAEPHIIGETPPEAESLKKTQPAESLALVIAQLARKLRRRIGRADSGKAPK